MVGGARLDPALLQAAGLQKFNEVGELPEHRGATSVVKFAVEFAANRVQHHRLCNTSGVLHGMRQFLLFCLYPLADSPQFTQFLARSDSWLDCFGLTKQLRFTHAVVHVRCDAAFPNPTSARSMAISTGVRGTCPSCGTRRMAEAAAHLADHVIPKLPVRQWVLLFPNPLRRLFAIHPALHAPVLQIIHRAIGTFLFKQSGQKRDQAATAAGT